MTLRPKCAKASLVDIIRINCYKHNAYKTDLFINSYHTPDRHKRLFHTFLTK